MTSEPLSTAELWELLSDELRGFLVRRVGDEHVAEDLLQETFLRIHRGLGELDEDRRLTAWVFQIARNLVVDHLRSRSGAPEGDTDEVGPDEQAADEEANLNELVRDWLPAMIARLPEPYGQAVELYELSGWPQQRIADQLGISLSGAKSRVQRGREKLKAMLFDCCSFERDRRGNVMGYSRNRLGSCPPCDAE